MCSTKQLAYAILAAILASVFAILFISALVQQFVNRGILASDVNTMQILGQYFVAFLFFGAAKCLKNKMSYCCDRTSRAIAKKRK